MADGSVNVQNLLALLSNGVEIKSKMKQLIAVNELLVLLEYLVTISLARCTVNLSETTPDCIDLRRIDSIRHRKLWTSVHLCLARTFKHMSFLRDAARKRSENELVLH